MFEVIEDIFAEEIQAKIDAAYNDAYTAAAKAVDASVRRRAIEMGLSKEVIDQLFAKSVTSSSSIPL